MEVVLALVGISIAWLLISKLLSLIKESKELRELKLKISDGDAYLRNKIAEGDRYYTERLAETARETNVMLERQEFVQSFIRAKISAFPEVATLIADLLTACDEKRARQLEIKSRPAYRAADEVRKIKAQKRELIKRIKALEWEMRYIRRLLPWLDEIENSPMEPANSSEEYINREYNPENDDSADVDNAGYWLTPEEYRSLSNVEKNQRALDRYNKRKKTNAEIGRDYERYIGYLFERNGFKVDYTGIKDGLNDLGRDLICTGLCVIYVVQCKCWSNKRGAVIREKHINQIYGTTFKYYLEQRKIRTEELLFGRNDASYSYQVIPAFVSTVPLSETAVEFAKELGIEFLQRPLEKYPVIKCNINSKGEKIYHLPFDQMYDKTDVSKVGEFYAMTVAEAEAAGFRRAKKWKG